MRLARWKEHLSTITNRIYLQNNGNEIQLGNDDKNNKTSHPTTNSKVWDMMDR